MRYPPSKKELLMYYLNGDSLKYVLYIGFKTMIPKSNIQSTVLTYQAIQGYYQALRSSSLAGLS